MLRIPRCAAILLQYAFINLSLCGLPLGALFGYFVVVPTVFDATPLLRAFFTILLIYGYVNIIVLWMLLRFTDTSPPSLGQCKLEIGDEDDRNEHHQPTACGKCGCISLQSHHCSMCRTCVSDHDHHCFAIGRCVARQNLEYFACFLLWWILGFVISIPILIFYYFYFWPETDLNAARWFDFVPPIGTIRFVHGYIGWRSFGIVLLTCGSCGLFILAFVMAVVHLYSVLVAKAASKLSRSDLIVPPLDAQLIRRRLRTAYGHCRWWQFFVPVSMIFDGKPRCSLKQALRGPNST